MRNENDKIRKVEDPYESEKFPMQHTFGSKIVEVVKLRVEIVQETYIYRCNIQKT